MEGNQEFRQITLDEWLYWKEDIRDKLRETAGNFVYIGYRLKQIRDSGMYDGAADIFEFARKEYGLGKSTVSRFIAINEKFSEGGDSLELKAEYRDIGSSKLAEMLTLPDAECSLITERTTVKEIRELKSFLRQQPEENGNTGETRQIQDLLPAVATPQQEERNEEVQLPGRMEAADYPEPLPESTAPVTEGTEAVAERAEAVTENTAAVTENAEAATEREEAGPGSAGAGGECRRTGKVQENSGKTREGAAVREVTAGLTPLEKCLAEYFRDKKELLNDVMALAHGGRFKAAEERMNPSGYGTYRKGLVFLFMYDFSQGVKYKVFGQPEVSELDWETFLNQIYAIYADLYESGADDVHGAYYREQEKEPVRKPGKEPGQKAAEAPSPEQEGMPAVEDGNAGETGKVQELPPSVATSQQEAGTTEDPAPGHTGAGKASDVSRQGEEAPGETTAETQLPGQMEVEDYPELLPECSSMEITGDVPAGEPSGPETAGAGKILREEEPDTAAGMPERMESAGSSIIPAGKESAEDIRTDANRYLESLGKIFAIWDESVPPEFLEQAHQDAVNLAAAIEKLMGLAEPQGNWRMPPGI